MERVLAPIIKGLLNKYFLNIPDLRLSIWSGDILLKNLSFRLDVIEKELFNFLPELESIFSIQKGTIGELEINIPWTSLTWQPIQITIHAAEVTLRALSSTDNEKNPVKEGKEESASKKWGVSVTEESSWHSFLKKVFSNISFNIKDIRVSYVLPNDGDITLLFLCKSIAVYSAKSNEDWERMFVDLAFFIY